MAAATEIFALLDGETPEVAERIQDVQDHLTLMGLHIAESRGRKRRKILAEIEARAFALEFSVNDAPAHLIKEVAAAIAEQAAKRPVSQELDVTLTDDEPYPVPGQAEFYTDTDGKVWGFMVAQDIEKLAELVIALHPEELGVCERFEIEFLWKAAGGAKGGTHATLGKTIKLGGQARFHAGRDFTVWLAADNLEGLEASFHQVKALLYHELKHIGMTDRGGPKIIPHDLELFVGEYAAYGSWRHGMLALAQQLALPMGVVS